MPRKSEKELIVPKSFLVIMTLMPQPPKSPQWFRNPNRDRSSYNRPLFRDEVPNREMENVCGTALRPPQLHPHHHLPLHHPRAEETFQQGFSFHCPCDRQLMIHPFQPLPDITLDSLPYHAWALDISEVGGNLPLAMHYTCQKIYCKLKIYSSVL